MAGVHYISMITIGVGSFMFGILPMVFSFRTRSYPFLLSLILCLGAGVLFATSLVHMLSEVQVKLKLYAQLYFCAGFLVLYSFDEITHYCLGNKLEIQTVEPDHERNHSDNGHYGTFDKLPGFSENSPFLKKAPDLSNDQRTGQCFSRSNLRCYEDKDEAKGGNQYLGSHCSHNMNSDENEIHSHLKCGQPYSSNPASKTGLLIALFIHSVLEGISIGVQTELSQIIFILGAVSFHKVALSFCLGLEIHSHGLKAAYLLSAVFFFSIGSPIGIFLGMTVTTYEKGIFGIDAQLQAVAAGSLLYVATLEVLPRERSKWKHSSKKAAGIFQFLFLLIGFTFITFFHLFVGLAHDNNNKNSTHTKTNLP